MSEVETRRINLLRRIEQKRKEICRYLDHQFYNVARSILKSIRELDTAHNFENNPSALPEYLAYVHHPMYWSLIDKKLTNYEYNTSAEFIADMREVVDNCYVYNKHSSPFSAMARDLEVRMEDEFVRQLGLPPPDIKELIRLGSHLPRETSAEVWKVISRYEKMTERPQGTRVHVSPAKYACATQRRIIALLRQAAVARAQHAASRASKAHPSQSDNNNITTNTANVVSPSSSPAATAAHIIDPKRMRPHSPELMTNTAMPVTTTARLSTNASNKLAPSGNVTNSYHKTGATLTRDMLAVTHVGPDDAKNVLGVSHTTTTNTLNTTTATAINNNDSTAAVGHVRDLANRKGSYNDDDDDEVEFHEEPALLSFPNAGASSHVVETAAVPAFTTTLERVPQNARSLSDGVHIVSPVNLEGYNSDDFADELG